MLRLENRHSGEVLVLTHERAGGIDILHLAGTLPPHRDGPPLHIHHFEDAVDTLLGKYRGTEWPGCPDRCVGVPRSA